MMPNAPSPAIVEALRTQVVRALDENDLLPRSQMFERTLLRVVRRGEKCRQEFLLPVIGERAWRRVSGRLGSTDSSLAGVLGFGEAMTEFFVAGVPMSRQAKSQVIRIGALSKFILSTHDKLVDNLGETDLIPRSMLVQAITGDPRSRRTVLPADSSRRVITRAVDAYFKLLYRLPFAQQRVYVREILGSAILSLFDVEASLHLKRGGAIAFDEETVKTKATLSFVSMGLPAWLASRRATQECVSLHWSWLCQLGEFLGWIDDLVDLEGDIELNFPNRVVLRLQRPNGQRPQAVNSLANEIATLGSEVADQWKDRLSTPSNQSSLKYFKTNILSWLGGSPDLWI
jgi:hypothetical protein